MAPQDVFLTRHGARIDKEDRGWLRKAGHSRQDDPHLSSGGEVGSKELAAKIMAVHQQVPIAHIVCSPFTRCVQTAYPVVQALGLPIKIEPGICEILSTFPPAFLDADELHCKFSAIDKSYDSVMKRSQLSAEYSDGQAARRAADVAKAIRSRLQGPIIFVGHGASCLGIAEAFGVSDYIGYTSLTHFKPEAGHWKVVGTFGDVSHLSDQQTSLNSAF
eukprot:TRINITY_DN52107_c0_g1_i1.p1 TRINITY_DN52107_c0_g1~~TRINITY_DN52107_c0_g1_i1.p1  ORF type:complete len:218 (+),score=23.92 TRINITY_DN52107_c0_g1_i1:47-700(+)